MHLSSLVASLLLPVITTATNFLNHTALLANVENAQWIEANVPILDFPDRNITEIYYFRWTTYHEHLFYTGAQYGYTSTEFTSLVGQAGPYNAISAAAGHHITEGRWLRDQKPGKDLVNFWLAGPGTFPKPATEDLNRFTFDWAHEYSFWVASAVYLQYLVTGDAAFATGHLDNLVSYYNKYDDHFNADLGLYWQVPVWDATEFTASSYEIDPNNGYHGGIGYRPTINSFQYGDALAISRLAALINDTSRSQLFSSKASSLQTAQQRYLWDSSAQFFKERARDNNPSGKLTSWREYMGYVPWQFNMPSVTSDNVAFAQLLQTSGFNATYGPTTLERPSSYFLKDAQNCCRWDGPSWPYATSSVLTAVENLLNNYQQNVLTVDDYYSLIRTYTLTHYQDGHPWVAEAHDPFQNNWIYNTPNHSEDYNHSTFIENIIAGLIGLRAQAGSSLVVNPLVPNSITYFGLENVAYHGHNITVLWDQTGRQYNQGQGLRVWVDNVLAANRSTLGSLTVPVGSVVVQPNDGLVNIAANPKNFTRGPQAYASFTSPFSGDNPQHAIDGSVFRPAIPQNSRWTSYSTTSPSDWWAVDFKRQQAVNNVRVTFYQDNDGVRLPTSYDLQYATTTGKSARTSWITVLNQTRTGNLAPNAQIVITFPQISAAQFRIVAPNQGNKKGWGISEFEVYAKPIFFIQNLNSNKLMAVHNNATIDDVQIQQYDVDGTRNHLWQFDPAPGGWTRIRNVNSDKLLTVRGASLANSTSLVQFSDQSVSGGNATLADAQLWRLQDWKTNGQFYILNKHSGLVAGVTNESTQNAANVVQYANTDTPDHLWYILPAVPAN